MAMIGKRGFHCVCDNGVKIYQLDPSYGLMLAWSRPYLELMYEYDNLYDAFMYLSPMVLSHLVQFVESCRT